MTLEDSLSSFYWQPELLENTARGMKIVLRLRDTDNPDDAAMVFVDLDGAQSANPASALVIIDPTRMSQERLFDRLAQGFVGFYHPVIRPICEAAAFELARNRPHFVLFDDLSATACGAMVYGYAKDPARPEREIAHWRKNARDTNSPFAAFLPEDIH